MEFSAFLPRTGLGLDIACGSGRHAAFLAERGLRVMALDWSEVALREGREVARQQGLGIDWVCANLERLWLPLTRFDVITCFYYRDPALYAKLRASLRAGGLLFYETYTREQLRPSSGPHNPDHLLEPGELLQAFGDWDVIFYRETSLGRGVAALVVRKRAP